jgi:hypothetical protein
MTVLMPSSYKRADVVLLPFFFSSFFFSGVDKDVGYVELVFTCQAWGIQLPGLFPQREYEEGAVLARIYARTPIKKSKRF